MRLKEAVKEYKNICMRYGYQTDEDIFIANELAKYIYEKTNNSEYLLHFANDLDSIQKIRMFEKHSDKNDPKVSYCLATIYYKGNAGIIDYKKAFELFTVASRQEHMGSGSIDDPYHQVCLDAKLYLAKMYKNGQYVKQNYEMYKKLVNESYDDAKDLKWHFQTTDILLEKAQILLSEKKYFEAKQILLKAREDVETKMYYTHVFEDDLKIINSVLKQYSCLDKEDIDYSIISELSNKPTKILFKYGKQKYVIDSRYSNDELLIRFEDQFFRSVNDFYENAYVNEEYCKLNEIITDTHNWEVLYE